MVMGYMPVLVVEDTAMVMVEVPEPGAENDVGLKLEVTPGGFAGCGQSNGGIEAARKGRSDRRFATAPCATETEVGEAEM